MNLDDDVAAAAEQHAREKQIGLGAAVNDLARAGLLAKPQRKPSVQRTHDLGLKIDVTNIGDVHELLDGWDADERKAA